MGNKLGVVATGAAVAADTRTINAGIKRHIALQPVGKANTGTFTSATVDLEITVNGTEYASVGTATLGAGNNATDIFAWTGVCLGYRYNVTALTVVGDAAIDLHWIDEYVNEA